MSHLISAFVLKVFQKIHVDDCQSKVSSHAFFSLLLRLGIFSFEILNQIMSAHLLPCKCCYIITLQWISVLFSPFAIVFVRFQLSSAFSSVQLWSALPFSDFSG